MKEVIERIWYWEIPLLNFNRFVVTVDRRGRRNEDKFEAKESIEVTAHPIQAVINITVVLTLIKIIL